MLAITDWSLQWTRSWLSVRQKLKSYVQFGYTTMLKILVIVVFLVMSVNYSWFVEAYF